MKMLSGRCPLNVTATMRLMSANCFSRKGSGRGVYAGSVGEDDYRDTDAAACGAGGVTDDDDESPIANYQLRITSYELQVTGFKSSRVQGFKS